MSFLTAITGSIGNAKMVLYPEVNGITFTKIEKSILVKNVNEESINVTLQIDEETAKFIELIDESFTLDAGEEENADFIVKVRKEGNYEGKIAVFFASLDEEKKAGVALSSTIVVVARKDQSYRENNIRETDDNTEEETTTGNVVTDSEPGVKSSSKNTLLLMVAGVFILLIILFILLILAVKKRKRRNGVKKNGAKRRKLNGKRARRR